jgi:phosphatidylinositol 4-kinase type 2
MGKSRPATSGYAKIAQAEEEDDESILSDEDLHQGQSRISVDADGTTYAPIQPKRRERMESTSRPSMPDWRSGLMRSLRSSRFARSRANHKRRSIWKYITRSL